MKKILHTLLLLVLVAAPQALAYDAMQMHPKMTRAAFAEADAQMMFTHRLGLGGAPFAGMSAADLAAMGSTSEDDGFRPIKHFLDPLNGLGISGKIVYSFPIPHCETRPLGIDDARTWALETSDQNLSVAKAHYRGLLTAPVAGDRNQHAARLFYALGHTMHLVQDMGQPQHTRNDIHLTGSDLTCADHPFLCHLDRLNRWSRYERWCRDNVARVGVGGYSMVRLADYGDYFAAPGRKGLADYANRNFVTEHTNYSDSLCLQYDEPVYDDATPRDETHTVTTTVFPFGSPVVSTVTYEDVVLSYPTSDSYLAGATTVNPNHNFHSYFDYEQQARGFFKVWSLPQSALKSQSQLLVPRAVGYSAGLLGHFFRGQILLKWKKNSDGTYNAVLTNTSAETLNGGQVSVTYMVPPGTHGAAPGQDLVPIFTAGVPTLGPGGAQTYSNLTIPGLGTNENFANFVQRVTVTGTLGSEQDAVIGLVEHPTVTTFGEGYITLRFEIAMSEDEDFYLAGQSRYYGNSFLAGIFNGVPVVRNNGIPNMTMELVSASGGTIVFDLSYYRRTHVLDMRIEQPCSNNMPSSTSVSISIDGEHYATYTGDLKSDGWNCTFGLPFFY